MGLRGITLGIIAVCMAWSVPPPEATAEEAGTAPLALPDNIDPALREQLETMDAKLAEVEDFEAAFVKARHTPLLKKPLVSRGVVKATRDVVLWETTEPRRSRTLIADDEVKLYDLEQERVEVYPLTGEMADFGASPLPRFNELARRFEIEQGSVEDHPGGVISVNLTPRSAELREYIERLSMTFDVERAEIINVSFHQGEGELTSYTFDSVTLDPGLDPGELTLGLAEDVEVVRPYGGGE